MEYYKRVVSKNVKFLKWFDDEFGNLPFNVAYKALRNKGVKLNGKRMTEDFEIVSGDCVELFLPEVKTQLDIAYEDEFICVFNKPAGIESEGENSFESQVKLQFDNLILANRLDRNTCGLIIFAKNQKVLDEIKKANANNLIEKTYLAWVYGNLKKPIGGKAFLVKDSKKALVKIYERKVAGAVEIETYAKPIKTVKVLGVQKTLCEVKIHNGKTHQIRAHLAYLGYPLVGDGKYAPRELFNQSKENKHLLFACGIKIGNKTCKFANLKNCKIEIVNKNFQ